MQRDDDRSYLMRLTPYRTSEDHIEGVVLTFVDITARRRAELALQQAHGELEARVEARTAELAEALDALRHEIAEREQIEAERQRLEAQARRAEHFALLGRLAAGVSHEIRNPLSVVFLQVDLLEEEISVLSSERQAQLIPVLDEVKIHLARLEDIVQDYLSLVRVGAIERGAVHLGALIQDLVRELEPELEIRGIALAFDGIATLGELALHEPTFRRALLNLMHNAMEAMPQGGTLTLRGRQTAAEVRLDIADSGVGIAADQQAQIFEPLHTTKPGGTGFGLYLVRETVLAHGGAISVASEVGQGATFTITLPRAAAEETGQG
jgi:signal transduction histidine kinase